MNAGAIALIIAIGSAVVQVLLGVFKGGGDVRQLRITVDELVKQACEAEQEQKIQRLRFEKFQLRIAAKLGIYVNGDD